MPVCLPNRRNLLGTEEGSDDEDDGEKPTAARMATQVELGGRGGCRQACLPGGEPVDLGKPWLLDVLGGTGDE
jgi:hypothetical protein